MASQMSSISWEEYIKNVLADDQDSWVHWAGKLGEDELKEKFNAVEGLSDLKLRNTGALLLVAEPGGKIRLLHSMAVFPDPDSDRKPQFVGLEGLKEDAHGPSLIPDYALRS